MKKRGCVLPGLPGNSYLLLWKKKGIIDTLRMAKQSLSPGRVQIQVRNKH